MPTPREQLAEALRIEFIRDKAERYGPGPTGSSRQTSWDQLPHERKRKWLLLAATAERVIAELNRGAGHDIGSAMGHPGGHYG